MSEENENDFTIGADFGPSDVNPGDSVDYDNPENPDPIEVVEPDGSHAHHGGGHHDHGPTGGGMSAEEFNELVKTHLDGCGPLVDLFNVPGIVLDQNFAEGLAAWLIAGHLLLPSGELMCWGCPHDGLSSLNTPPGAGYGTDGNNATSGPLPTPDGEEDEEEGGMSASSAGMGGMGGMNHGGHTGMNHHNH